MSRPYRPPSKRRLQVEAWGIALTFVIVGWCFVGGVWMGLKLLWALLGW
jgi:hypothetical protein